MSGLVILGGPASGKTTYLASVITGITDGESDLFEDIVPPPDASVVERLEDALLDGEYPDRTSKRTVQALSLELKTTQEQSVHLNISDYAGEQVEDLFKKRTEGWSEEWAQRAQADGILLFIRPPSWIPLPRLEPRVCEPGVVGPARVFDQITPNDQAGVASQQGSSRSVPTELAVIELLQFLRYVRGLAAGERPSLGSLRIALVVSAWDAIDASWQEQGPERYVDQHSALLRQYLWSNFHADDVRIFGLSATGGNLKDESYQVRYQNRSADERAGYVVWTGPTGTVERREDVTIPLGWALLGEDAVN